MQRKCASAHHLRNDWTAADMRGKVCSLPSNRLVRESPVLGTGSQFQFEGPVGSFYNTLSAATYKGNRARCKKRKCMRIIW
jgi:hypothetical protein